MAFTGIREYTSAGLMVVHWGYNTGGYFTGTNKTPTSSTTPNPAGTFVAAKTASLSIPEAERVNATGNNKRIRTFSFENPEETGFEFSLAAADLDFQAAIMGTKIETLGTWDLGLIRPGTTRAINITMIINTDAASEESASTGEAGYFVQILPLMLVRYRGASNVTERTVHDRVFSATINPFARKPWGELLTSLTNGDVLADGLEGTSPYPVFAEHIQTTTAVAYTLTKTPGGDDTSGNVHVFLNGVKLTATSGWTLNATTRVLTLAVAPVAADKLEVWYGYIP